VGGNRARPLSAAAALSLLVSCTGHGVSTIPAVPGAPADLHGLHRSTASANAYAAAVLADSPTAYYHLDDTGTIAHDASGHSLNGTVGSSVTEDAAGLISTNADTAMAFPGLATAAGVVSFPQTAQLQPASAVSIEAWVRYTATPAEYAFVTGYGSDSAEAPYGFYFGSGGRIHMQLALTGGTVDLTAPKATAANITYYLAATFDGKTARFYVNGTQVNSATGSGTFKNYQSGYGFSIGDDARLSDPAFKGTVDEVAVYAGKALTAARVAAHFAAATAYVDWSTFGYDLQRTGDNPNERTLTVSSVAHGLRTIWSTNLGAAITAQPVLATSVAIGSATHNVLYVGTEGDVFYAIDADTGSVLWKNTTLGSAQKGPCNDLPGGEFGITGTATFDKSAGVVYVADGSDLVHALSMSTGAEQWNTNALYDPSTGADVGAPSTDHIYGALTLNPSNGMLYAYTASFCDVPPWHGRIVAISTAAHDVVAAFFPAQASGPSGTNYCGGGIWGMGGASIDPVTNDVFVASGNDLINSTAGGCPDNTLGETYPYGDAVVQLSPQLGLISYQTATINGKNVSNDSDYGATPMLYAAPDCSTEQTSAKNKDGYIYTYGESSALVPEQQIAVGNVSSDGEFIGVPAWDPKTGLLYVGNPNPAGTYANGLNAFAQAGGCTGLTLAWKASIGAASAKGNDNEAPTVANGVVYFTDGQDDQLWAFNDATGAVLWHSGTAIGSPCTSYGGACGVFGAATVDQRVFVGSFNHKLYAFGL